MYKGRKEGRLTPQKAEFARSASEGARLAGRSNYAIADIQPTTLIGASGRRGTFSQNVVSSLVQAGLSGTCLQRCTFPCMSSRCSWGGNLCSRKKQQSKPSKHVSVHVSCQAAEQRVGRAARPLILALSNPVENAECTAQEAAGEPSTRLHTRSGTQWHHPERSWFQASKWRASAMRSHSCRLVGRPSCVRQRNSIRPSAIWKHQQGSRTSQQFPDFPRCDCQLDSTFRTIYAAGLSPLLRVQDDRPLHATLIVQVHKICLLRAGIGLGCIAVGATQVTDGMMLAAARAVGEQTTRQELSRDSVLPDVKRLRCECVCSPEYSVCAPKEDTSLPLIQGTLRDVPQCRARIGIHVYLLIVVLAGAASPDCAPLHVSSRDVAVAVAKAVAQTAKRSGVASTSASIRSMQYDPASAWRTANGA